MRELECFFFFLGGELPGTSAKDEMCQSRDFGVDIHSTIVAGGNFFGNKTQQINDRNHVQR